MKFSMYLIFLVLSINLSLSQAWGGAGGTGTPFPTDNSSVVASGVAGGGGGFPMDNSMVIDDDSVIIIKQTDLVNDLKFMSVGTGFDGFTSKNSKLSKELNLSYSETSAELDLDGFTKIKITPSEAVIKSKTISKAVVSDTLNQMSQLTASTDARDKFQMSAEKVHTGEIDLIYLSDEDGKVILMKSSKGL